ncbi:zinc finger protein 493-like [Belonocnema kinseyi]|uniref:zinc finger protein 493-like n=1 Tax=Belonocnema kinseyi TaxID=2817044 RepID=UPI00143D77B1|nr:zinc finger protein 493-like [Belonocnema kinseyi]
MSQSRNSTSRKIGKPSSFTDISSKNNSIAKTLIEYDIDETLEIKEEILEVPETITGQNDYETYDSVPCAADISAFALIRDDDISLTKCKLRSAKKQEIQGLKHQTKYKCEQCERFYTQEESLTLHKKFECSVAPLFKCELCEKLFKQKAYLNLHVDLVHTKTYLQTLRTRHNCDKCPRNYRFISGLNQHKHLEHASAKSQFNCEFCEYKSNRKVLLLTHIASHHSQALKSRYNCDKCSRTFVTLYGLNQHKHSEHAIIKLIFVCDLCGYKSNEKANLIKHMSARHMQISNSRHKCEKCYRSYASSYGLYKHKRLEHAKIKP